MEIFGVHIIPSADDRAKKINTLSGGAIDLNAITEAAKATMSTQPKETSWMPLIIILIVFILGIAIYFFFFKQK